MLKSANGFWNIWRANPSAMHSHDHTAFSRIDILKYYKEEYKFDNIITADKKMQDVFAMVS